MSDSSEWKAGMRSVELFEQAVKLLPGGVNSPVRAFNAVGGQPFFVDRAQGPYVWDADDNRYIDYVCSWGPLILGHSPPDVVEAVISAARKGTSFGAPHEGEITLAQEVCRMMPSVELVRMVNSGTEATMSAVRLARGFTGRAKIVKFEGCYHGHADAFLIKAGSGAATFGVPNSPGVTEATVSDTLIAAYNDLETVAEQFEAHGDDIAAVIVEPVAGNMGCVPPATGFLEGLRDLCDKYEALLVFDEPSSGLDPIVRRDILEAIGIGKGPESYIISVGCAGWGPGQLELEIKENVWLTGPVDEDILFEIPVELRWQEAVKKIGINPEALSDQAGHA